jgi:hypothetical protein
MTFWWCLSIGLCDTHDNTADFATTTAGTVPGFSTFFNLVKTLPPIAIQTRREVVFENLKPGRGSSAKR